MTTDRARNYTPASDPVTTHKGMTGAAYSRSPGPTVIASLPYFTAQVTEQGGHTTNLHPSESYSTLVIDQAINSRKIDDNNPNDSQELSHQSGHVQPESEESTLRQAYRAFGL